MAIYGHMAIESHLHLHVHPHDELLDSNELLIENGDCSSNHVNYNALAAASPFTSECCHGLPSSQTSVSRSYRPRLQMITIHPTHIGTL
jgi:hypothetical protein